MNKKERMPLPEGVKKLSFFKLIGIRDCAWKLDIKGYHPSYVIMKKEKGDYVFSLVWRSWRHLLVKELLRIEESSCLIPPQIGDCRIESGVLFLTIGWDEYNYELNFLEVK